MKFKFVYLTTIPRRQQAVSLGMMSGRVMGLNHFQLRKSFTNHILLVDFLYEAEVKDRDLDAERNDRTMTSTLVDAPVREMGQKRFKIGEMIGKKPQRVQFTIWRPSIVLNSTLSST